MHSGLKNHFASNNLSDTFFQMNYKETESCKERWNLNIAINHLKII